MNEDIIGILVGGLAIAGIFGIPIVAILTKHQQKMAMIMRQDAAQNTPGLEHLYREMADVKQLVHDQTIAIDSLREITTRLSENTIRERLSQSEVNS